MAVAAALRSVADIESFMIEYYAAWGGTDEDCIMSYYADNVTVQIPGSFMQGKTAVREIRSAFHCCLSRKSPLREEYHFWTGRCSH